MRWPGVARRVKLYMPTTSCALVPASVLKLLTSFVGCSAVLLSMAITAACAAQNNDGFPKKTGVTEPGVQREMSELKPEVEFAVSGHPDWLAVTDDAVWVTSSSANHVVRLDAKTNKPDTIITLEKPCSGLAIGFGSLWIPSCGSHNLARADARTGAIQATIAANPADSEGGITTGAGSVWLVTSATSELDRIDPATNAVAAKIQLPKGSFNPIFAGDSVWVASNEGNSAGARGSCYEQSHWGYADWPKATISYCGGRVGLGIESRRRHGFPGRCFDRQVAGYDSCGHSRLGRRNRLRRRFGLGNGLRIPDHPHRSEDQQGRAAVGGQGRRQHPLCTWIGLAYVSDWRESVAA